MTWHGMKPVCVVCITIRFKYTEAVQVSYTKKLTCDNNTDKDNDGNNKNNNQNFAQIIYKRN